MRDWYVHLYDGTQIYVADTDDDDVVLAAGSIVGQDIAHLVKKVEAL